MSLARMKYFGVVLVVLSLYLAGSCNGIPRGSLYPHGDTKLPTDQDEVSSPEITLKVPIVFYGDIYNTIYVNSNGLLSFLTEIPSFFNIQFPLDYPVIAPLYTNVDTRGSGTVYYRETDDAALLQRATSDIHEGFLNATNFVAKSLFIATWTHVGYFKEGSDKVNTYQAIVASNGLESYLTLLYVDGGIQWIQGSGQSSGLPDARAQAGVVASDGRLYTLRGSGTDQIQNLDKWSNAGKPGVWLFRIGQTGPTGNVGLPDALIEDESIETLAPLTCQMRSTDCHSKASCVNHNKGYCCYCVEGYYGNGINCLKEGIPLRVNGKLYGNINGEELPQSDLQSYVVTSDGRTYTAVSRVPETIGFNMQTLNVLGGLIGWLFAKPVGNATNGYQLTGGVLNQTVDIMFPETNDKITLVQHYLGLDVFDQLKMDTEIRGTLPVLPSDSKVQIADYEEQYTKSEPGIMNSHSYQSYRIGDSIVNHPFNVEQSIQFNECQYAPEDSTTIRLKVARNFISYETRENIVRYAMTGKTIPPGENDPCKEGHKKCSQHSSCLVDGDNFKCICNRGYQYLYDADFEERASCVDVNECTTGTSNCDINAICINEPGSFSCHCPQGFTGDGRTCIKLPTCRDLNCHPQADCIESTPGLLQCQCREDHQGDGLYCEPLDEHGPYERTCDVLSNCSPFGVCTLGTFGYSCVCLPGYDGDGYSCNKIQLPAELPAESLPQTCFMDLCWCQPGYKASNQLCILKNQDQDETHLSCNTLNKCHPHALCIYSAGQHRCRCNAGYEGDGYECNEIDVSCHEVDICHNHATCILNEQDKAICMCNPGYQGDGTLCSPIEECEKDIDCIASSRCLWVAHHARHECVCDEGLQREGSLCIQKLPLSCNILHNCDRHAQCLYNTDTEEHTCQCNTGYSGDGKSCTELIVGCNILNNCAQGADCLYNNEVSGYRCKCKQGYKGNGINCVSEQTCLQNPFLCGPDATCVLSSRGLGHICQCNDGYTGNGVLCKVASQFAGNFLLLHQGMATLRIPFSPTSSNPGKLIAIQYDQVALGIDIDCTSGRVYWSDNNGHIIKSSNYDGSNVTIFLNEDIRSPEGVTVDWVSRNLYWADSSKDTIEMANLDTKERKVIASEGLVNPRGMAVYPAIGKIFWSDWNRAAPKLEWANLDGSERAVFLEDSSVQLPNSLAVDIQRDELCWADAGSKHIECIGISRRNKRTIVTDGSYPFGLTVSADNYYWTDWDTHKIESAQRPSGKRNDPINVPLGGSGKLYGIVAVPESCPR